MSRYVTGCLGLPLFTSQFKIQTGETNYLANVGSTSAERFSGSFKTLDSCDRDRWLVSLDRAECFALQKTRRHSYIVIRKPLVYEASVSVGFKCTKLILSCDTCTRCGPVCLHALRTLCMRCGPVCLHALWTCLFTDTYMPDGVVGKSTIVHYPQKVTMGQSNLLFKVPVNACVYCFYCFYCFHVCWLENKINIKSNKRKTIFQGRDWFDVYRNTRKRTLWSTLKFRTSFHYGKWLPVQWLR